MMSARSKVLVCAHVISALFLSAGCSEEDPCLTIAVEAIVVTVRDDATDERLCDATVEISKGNEVANVTVGTPTACAYSTFGAGTSVAGTYEVRVSAAGYSDSEPVSVVVREEPECHQPVTEHVTVRLQPI